MTTVGIGLDLITWVTPHYVVWGLHVRLAHKVAISAIFAFGILYDQSLGCDGKGFADRS